MGKMNRKQNTKINEATGDLNSLEILEWDSSFFGYKVGKSTAREISPFLMNNLVEQAGRQGVRLLYVFMQRLLLVIIVDSAALLSVQNKK